MFSAHSRWCCAAAVWETREVKRSKTINQSKDSWNHGLNWVNWACYNCSFSEKLAWTFFSWMCHEAHSVGESSQARAKRGLTRALHAEGARPDAQVHSMKTERALELLETNHSLCHFIYFVSFNNSICILMAVVVFIQALLESSSENDSGKVSTERGSFLENRLTD